MNRNAKPGIRASGFGIREPHQAPGTKHPAPKPRNPCESRALVLRALFLQVNSELLTFLVQVASFKAERPCRFGDAIVVCSELAQDHLALESCDALCNRPARRYASRPAYQQAAAW